MPTPSQRKIHGLHSQLESQKLDFKLLYNLRISHHKKELAKDICAIANFLFQTSGQGHLIIGTDNSRTPIGINPGDYIETQIQEIVARRTDPPPIFDVHHVIYNQVHLVIIVIRRSNVGPHQLIQSGRYLGFPIRRGSTTDIMNTTEVFRAMQVRGRRFSRQQSEYETLAPQARYVQLVDDCKDTLYEIGFSPNSVERIEDQIHYAGRYIRSRFTVRGIKTINHRRWIFRCLLSSDNANKENLFSLDNYDDYSQSHPSHRSIIIYIVHGTISSSYFNSRMRFFSSYTKINIEPKITYFGLGEGSTNVSNFESFYVPKFFVSHIKSKEDMKLRIDIILNWINQHGQMFEDIRTALSP